MAVPGDHMQCNWSMREVLQRYCPWLQLLACEKFTPLWIVRVHWLCKERPIDWLVLFLRCAYRKAAVAL
jgi:hypothetical protein